MGAGPWNFSSIVLAVLLMDRYGVPPKDCSALQLFPYDLSVGPLKVITVDVFGLEGLIDQPDGEIVGVAN